MTRDTIRIEFTGRPCSINRRYNKNFSLTNEYRTFKEELGYLAREQMIGKKMLLDALGLDIEYFYKKHEKDIDSFIKPVLDALQGIVYSNDKQVKYLNVRKHQDITDGLIISIHP